MKGKWFTMLMLFLALGCAGAGRSSQDEVPRMSGEELKSRLGTPDLVIIDARSGNDWASSEMKIAGAVREDPRRFNDWKNSYSKSKTLVLYCD